MLGITRNTVRLLPHDSEWLTFAQKSISEISSVIGNAAIDIRLIGSTAIPELSAKPILDILIGVRRFSDIEPFFDQLEAIGYKHKLENDTENKLFLSANLPIGGDNSDPERRTHHVHIVIYGMTLWNSYTAFCNRLKTDAELRLRYEQLKESLAAQYPNDRKSYTLGKTEFIRHTLRTKCDIKERSCGAVVWKKRGGIRYYLLIQNRSGHSGFPKGHMEYGENEEETALREIYEETSLKVTLDTSFRAEYRYLVDGYIHKSVLYFLANYNEGTFHPQAGEVFGIWLLPFDEALERLDYEQDRRVLRMAEKRLVQTEQ